MKTLIISTHFNSTDFIELQYISFKKYFKTNFDFIVFNDAKNFKDYTNYNDDSFESKILNKCNELNIKCIRISQEIHTNRKLIFPETIQPDTMDACTRCADSVQTAFNYAVNNCEGYDYILLIDSDMFFVFDFDIENYMKNKNISFLGNGGGDFTFSSEEHVYYMWNGIAVFNTKLPGLKEICWDCGRVNGKGVDVGGQTHHYLKKYKNDLKPIFITNGNFTFENSVIDFFNEKRAKRFEEIGNKNQSDKYIIFYNNMQNLLIDYAKTNENNSANKELLLSDTIFHLRSGGNWNKLGLEKMNINFNKLKKFIIEN